jgi:putative ABC transport system permease protein
MAETFWPGESPLGKTLILPWGDGIELEVVGIVGDVRNFGPISAIPSVFYLPFGQFPNPTLQVAVRTEGEPTSVAGSLRNALRRLDPDVPLAGLHTMESRFADRVALPRFRTTLLGVFAAVALIMASLGLYGVLAYFVSQRTHEMGIRMALGADGKSVMLLVLRRGLVLAGIGIVLGLAGSLAGARLMESLLFETAPTDVQTFAAASFCLAAVALAASLVPARRAVTVDPLVALRYE